MNSKEIKIKTNNTKNNTNLINQIYPGKQKYLKQKS